MFIVGQKYSRAKDIHDRFGGGRQSGISSSASHPFIFLFSGQSGENHGYEDGWHPDEELFVYTGEGQLGDMEFSRGNKAIRNHVKDGKKLLLFKALGKGLPVEYVGEFDCVSIGFGQCPDTKGDVRKTIRFNLARAGEVLSEEPNLDQPTENTLEELRIAAFNSVAPPETKDWRSSAQIKRQRRNDIKRYVLKRAGGACELTGEDAPFIKYNGEPFLEVHHIKRLSDGGLDHPMNCAAITPNAHREIHYGANGKSLDHKLADIIHIKEASLSSNG
jgi:5-methylcytosine-specific restriction protein A